MIEALFQVVSFMMQRVNTTTKSITIENKNGRFVNTLVLMATM